MNFATSSGLGGSPVRSKLKRRINVRRSASGEDESFSCSSFARMNTSIGLRAHSLFFTSGRGGRVAGLQLHQSHLSASACAGGGTLSDCVARAVQVTAAQSSNKRAVLLKRRSDFCVCLTVNIGSVD